MPRVHGWTVKRDKIWFDTNVVEPGQTQFFFQDCAEWKKQFKTNIHVPGQLGNTDGSYVMMGIGARLIGKTRQEEELLLDHLLIKLIMGDQQQHDILGPHASMLRDVYSKEELETYQNLADEPPTPAETKIERRELPPWRAPAYLFARPIVLPVRQHMRVDVLASDELPEAINMRIHIFGMLTRDRA